MNSTDRPSQDVASPGNAPTEPPTESPAPAHKQALSPLVEFGRGLAIAAIAASALLWVFTNADTVSVTELQQYSRVLRDFRQADTQINADVLAIAFELHKNYDAISQDINRINTLLKRLDSPPAFLSEDNAEKLRHHVDELDQLARTKHDQIEIFIRESAILRNSARYFPTAIKQLSDLSPPAHLRTDLAALNNNVMNFLATGDAELLPTIFEYSDSLRRKSANLPPRFTHKLNNALDHVGIAIKNKQAVISKLYVITKIPTDTGLEKVVQTYNIGHKDAVSSARIYRVLLFASALLLAIYLTLIFIRLGRTTHALQDSNRSLEQRIDELHCAQGDLKLYATLFSSAVEGMVITDANSRVLLINPAFTTITGYRAEEARVHPPSWLNSSQHSKALHQDMWKTIEQYGKWHGEIWSHRKNGEIYPEWLSITAISDDTGSVTHYIGVFSDITEHKKNESRIQHLSQHDPLTNLANRLLMQEKLNEALAQSQRTNSHTAVLFANLDRFRSINDTLGNELGDALLQQVAHRGQSLLRDTDTVSRLGSDEFVFILPDVNQPQDAAGIARKLLANISRPYTLGGHEITITASIGIALSGTDGDTAAELLRNADAAMNRAKEGGRNNFRFYFADMNASALGDLLLENQLRNAIKYNELELFYQPKVDSRTGAMQGAEALLRWRHPEQGMIPPDRFIRLAEESGLITSIGEWVLRTACCQIRTWREIGLPVVPIAVNLSAQQLLHSDLSSLVSNSLETAGIEPDLLELELTESMLVRNADHTIGILSHLRKMGVSLSIDDFGTGYSSLSYLKQFEVNLLKIDRSFVADIKSADTGGTIAIAIIGLAHALGMKVVAEGVETDEQRRFLINHSCDFFQGYLFSRPVPASDFAQKLAGLKNGAEA